MYYLQHEHAREPWVYRADLLIADIFGDKTNAIHNWLNHRCFTDYDYVKFMVMFHDVSHCFDHLVDTSTNLDSD